jgi:CBS domain-containing protein
VGIAAQTRAQAIDIAGRLAAVCDHKQIGLLWGRADVMPDTHGCPIIGNGMKMWPDTGGCIRVATKSKWLFSEPEKLRADVLIVDEAYQCTYADVGALGSMAAQIVCVGDPGQIDPVITGDTSRWATSATGPHVPAPFALQAAYPDIVNTVALQYTWRLGPDTTAMVQGRFYPDLPFTSRRPAEHLSKRGVMLPELTHRTLRVANGATDSALIRAAVERVHELIDDTDLTTNGETRHLTETDVAVVVPHVPQAAAIRAMLAQYPGVLVGTADALQGLERAAVVAVHPLSGKRTADEFSVKPGRACVMLSRHRSHLSLLVDDQAAKVLGSGEGDNVEQAAAVLDDMLATAEF